MQNVDQWIVSYLDFCRYQKGLDPKTLKAYRIDLAQFALFLQRGNMEPTREHVMLYISDLHQSYKPRSIRRKVASLKAFFGYLEYEGRLVDNPFAKLRLKLTPPKILPRTIPLATIEQILTVAYLQKGKNLSEPQRADLLRDIAVLELLFATGVRVSELCSLTCGDVRLEEGEVKIYGKGSKERIVQIANPSVLQVLREYQEANRQAIEQAGTFFANRLQKPLSDQSVRGIIRKYEKLAGMELHITPHMFRHSFATLLLEEDVDIRYIQRLLGHSSIVTTQIYTHVAGKKQRDILSAKHPRNRINL